jgi:hypothetical protein
LNAQFLKEFWAHPTRLGRKGCSNGLTKYRYIYHLLHASCCIDAAPMHRDAGIGLGGQTMHGAALRLTHSIRTNFLMHGMHRRLRKSANTPGHLVIQPFHG